MKEKETVIMIRAKSPTIMHPERLYDMKAILREQIAEKYKCEEMISHTYEEGQSRIIRFYICRKGGGGLKNSLRYRLEKDLARMKRQWLPMTGYAVMIASGTKQ